MSITSSAGSRAASLGGKSSGRSGRNLSPALVVIATAQRWWCRHALLSLRILADRNRSGAYLIMLLLGTAMFGIFFFLTIFVQTVLGYSALRAGVAFLPFAGTMVVASGVVSRLLTRIGTRPAGRRRDRVGGARHRGVDGGGQQRPRQACGGRPIRPLPGQRPGAGRELPRRPRDGYRPRVPGGFGDRAGRGGQRAGRHPGPARGPRQLPGGRSKAAGKPHPAMAGHIHVAGLATESADIGAPYPREGAP
jgi:hypothetical protein